METNHEAVMKINKLLIEGDPKALNALLRTHELNEDNVEEAILGYDFQRNEPRILLYAR